MGSVLAENWRKGEEMDIPGSSFPSGFWLCLVTVGELVLRRRQCSADTVLLDGEDEESNWKTVKLWIIHRNCKIPFLSFKLASGCSLSFITVILHRKEAGLWRQDYSIILLLIMDNVGSSRACRLFCRIVLGKVTFCCYSC